MATEKPLYKSIDMTKAMREADKAKATQYPTYKFSGGHYEMYADRIGGTPRFIGRK